MERERVFKTAWFGKAARKAHISDEELCTAAAQAALGQAADLGGGVIKKRIGKNLYRSILVVRRGSLWVFVYLFAKKDRANITPDELIGFRDLADIYQRKTSADLEREIQGCELMEICNEQEPQI